MLIQLSDPHVSHQRCHRLASRVISHHGHGGPGVAGRAGVGVDPRFTVRLDTDPRTDPPIPPTAQVRPTLTDPDRLQTHPHLWGVPPGVAHA